MLEIKSDDITSLQSRFVEQFQNSLDQINDQERIVIGLSGGSSVNTFYIALKDNFAHIQEQIRKKIFFCLLDERVVAFHDPDSNIRGLKEIFLDQLVKDNLLKSENILLPDFSQNDYGKKYFDKVGKIDIGLFGVGPDGHTCSLFPKHELLSDEHVRYLEINDSPKPPKSRITISKNMLKQIRNGFVFFMGESKKEALINFIDPKVDFHNCPAKLILSCKNSFLISDILK